MTPKLAL